MKKLLLLFLLLQPLMMMAQNITVKGRIVERKSHKPLATVSVTQYGTTNSTLSDADGYYQITVQQDSKLKFELKNYGVIMSSVNGKDNIDIIMRKKRTAGSKFDSWTHVKGHVYDEKTQASVANFRIGQLKRKFMFSRKYVTRTDENGNYEIDVSGDGLNVLTILDKRKYYRIASVPASSEVLNFKVNKVYHNEFSILGGYWYFYDAFGGLDREDLNNPFALNFSYMYSFGRYLSIGPFVMYGRYNYEHKPDSWSNNTTKGNMSLISSMLCFQVNFFNSRSFKNYCRYGAGIINYDISVSESDLSQNISDKASDSDFYGGVGVSFGGKHVHFVCECGVEYGITRNILVVGRFNFLAQAGLTFRF